MRRPRSGGDDERCAIRGQPSGVCGCNRVARPRPLASYPARQRQGRSDMRIVYIKDVCLLYATPVGASPAHDRQRGRGASRSMRWATRPATGPGGAWPPWCSQVALLVRCQAVPRGYRARALDAHHHGLDTQETPSAAEHRCHGRPAGLPHGSCGGGTAEQSRMAPCTVPDRARASLGGGGV